MELCHYCGKVDEIGHYVKPDYHHGLLWCPNFDIRNEDNPNECARFLTCPECRKKLKLEGKTY